MSSDWLRFVVPFGCSGNSLSFCPAEGSVKLAEYSRRCPMEKSKGMMGKAAARIQSASGVCEVV